MGILYFFIFSTAFVFLIGTFSLMFDVIDYFNPDYIDKIYLKFFK